MNETEVLSSSLSNHQKSAHCCTLASFKDVSQAEFGQRGVPAAVNTSWKSTLRQVKAVLQCDHSELGHVLQQAGHKHRLFPLREWNQLKELLEVLNFSIRRSNGIDTGGDNVHDQFCCSICPVPDSPLGNSKAASIFPDGPRQKSPGLLEEKRLWNLHQCHKLEALLHFQIQCTSKQLHWTQHSL